VLISSRIPRDPLDRTTDLAELLRRLRTQAPRMPVLVMHDGSAAMPPGADGADAIVTRPTTGMLVDRRSQAEVARQAEQLRDALESWSQPVSQGAPAAPARSAAPPTSAPVPGLQRLREISARLRDPATRGDVLNLVLEFAAESFGRVAMFMVRDDLAVGIAQRGLSVAGGPGDDEFRELRVLLDEPAWFRTAIESGEAHTAPPQNEGDRRLWAMLGSSAPGEAHLAPIESGGHVAALLYADNLPEGSPIGDTTMLSIVLHEAGLVLDRALLERALAEAELPAGSPQFTSRIGNAGPIRPWTRFPLNFGQEGKRAAHPDRRGFPYDAGAPGLGSGRPRGVAEDQRGRKRLRGLASASA